MNLLAGVETATVILAIVLVVLLIAVAVFCVKRCPPDKILIVYGTAGKVVNWTHGGILFVFPLLQRCFYLDLNSVSADVDLKKEKCGTELFDVHIKASAAISTLPEAVKISSQYLCFVRREEIAGFFEAILVAQIRQAFSELSPEQVKDREVFFQKVTEKTEQELKKLGMTLLNFVVFGLYESEGEKKEMSRVEPNADKKPDEKID